MGAQGIVIDRTTGEEIALVYIMTICETTAYSYLYPPGTDWSDMPHPSVQSCLKCKKYHGTMARSGDKCKCETPDLVNDHVWQDCKCGSPPREVYIANPYGWWSYWAQALELVQEGLAGDLWGDLTWGKKETAHD